MIRVALRGLAGRKFRASLTAIAIVLGVAMVSGTYILTDTIDKAFHEIFSDSYAETDAVVTGPSPDISFQGTSVVAEPVDESVLEVVQGVDGVEAAAGGVFDQVATKILDRDGKALTGNGAPTIGVGFNDSPEAARFNPLNLEEGRWPSAPNEVAIDAGTADGQDYAVGDRIRVATLQPVREFELVGIAKYGNLNSLGTATFAVFEMETAQQLLDREGKFDQIQVAAEDSVSPDDLVQRLEAALPADTSVQSGVAQAEDDSEEVSEFTTFIEYFLLAFAGIALFVGAFVIFNTLSITVAQRTRELATLRTIGASRRQVLGSVVLEALVIGVLASLAGLGLGVLLAAGLNELFKALELDLPATDLVFAPRTIIVSLAVGIIVTVLAGTFPALRATRVPPIAAVREGATLPQGRLAPYMPFIALAIIVGSLALLGYAMFSDSLDTLPRLLSIAVGSLALFIGVAAISPKAVPPLARVLSPTAKWLMLALGVLFYPVSLAAWFLSTLVFEPRTLPRRPLGAIAGALSFVGLVALVVALSAATGPVLLVAGAIVLVFSLARMVLARVRGRRDALDFPTLRPDRSTEKLSGENSARNPGRTAATAGALMIGLALVTFVAVLSQGMKESNRGALEDQVIADYVVTSQSGFQPFVAAAGDALEQTDAELVTQVRADLAQVAGSDRYLTGIEPEKITAAYNFQWQEGSNDVLPSLRRGGAVIDDAFAEDKGLEVGDTFQLLVPRGETRELQVAGIYEPPPFYPLLGSVSVSTEVFDRLYDRPRNQFTFVNVAGDPTEEKKAELTAAVAEFPDAKLQTLEEWITQQDEDFNQFLTMLYVLLALSVIVSIFGMVNTLVLSVFERTRELGMLRAVGMTRRQVRRMIRHESVITALIGAALGLPLGIFLAALVTRALSQFEVEYAVPLDSLLIFAVVSVVVGVLAAIAPARRAARLNVLNALQYE